MLRNRLRVSHSTFREIASSIVLLDHSAAIENTVFEDNVTDDTRFFAASAIRFHFSSDVIIRDSVFRNNIGAAGALYVDAATPFNDSPSLNLEGCITAENNIPGDFIDGGNHITDSSTGPCDKTIVIGPPPPPSPGGDKPHRKSRPDGGSSVFALKKRVHTCPELAPEIIVTDLTGETQCQRIGPAGVGKADVLAAGLIDAVDVWSWVAQDTLVCFQARGPVMVFLDAAYAPRTVELLPVYQLGELTCTAIEGAGSVVLLRSTPAGLQSPSWAVAAAPKQSLAGCMATLRAILNLRRIPGGEVIEMLPAGSTLTALRRQSNWIEVDYHGQRGWVSLDYVNLEGDCA